MSIALQNAAVYGPVRSRRLGSSLGINLLPAEVKFCLSDCLYCQYGRTNHEAMRKVKLRSAKELLEEINEEFSGLSSEGLCLDRITFSGNGEPTLHPELGTLVRGVKILRDKYFPKTSLAILSDSTRVHLPKVREALSLFDEKYMKLDAGNPETYQIINGPMVKIDWQEMIQGLKELPSITLQSLFISAPIDNAHAKTVRSWLGTVAWIRPKAVHLYTVDRPAADPRVRPVPLERLLEISDLVRRIGGGEAEVFQ